MSDAIEVHIDCGEQTCLVGWCRYFGRRGRPSSVFEYANEWLNRPNAFAIDPANLPLQTGPFYTSSEKSALPGALRDTAPDRWGRLLARRALRKQGRSRTLSEVDYLLAITDRARTGALRYRREGEETFEQGQTAGRVPPVFRLSALLNAADAIHGHTEEAEDIRLLLHEGSPIGGARPKSVVEDKDGALSIAKFPKPDDLRSIPHGEVLAMTLARQAGVRVSEARLEDVAGRPVALIKRFDRCGRRRIPFLSAMSLLGLQDGDVATYIDIAECIRFWSSAPTEDLHELWRRIVFNVLTGNLDDHLRNHGFLYDGRGAWRLAPAYDLNPVPVEEKARELTTWISEEGPEANVDQARRAASHFALKSDQADTILDEVSAALKDWRKIARQLGMGAPDMGAYASAFGE